MSRGRSNKLVGQTGEYLVAAELSRRGMIATTFTGNVPHYDIIASDEVGHHLAIQVKASRGGSWQFANITNFCELSFSGRRQIVGRALPCPIRKLVVVFVRVKPDGNDRYYILTWEELRTLLMKEHKAYLNKHNGIRPKRWDSLHCGLKEESVRVFQDRWETIEENL